MNDFLASTGLTGGSQTIWVPILLVAILLVVWRAVRLGRRLAMFFLLVMMVLPWVAGYAAYAVINPEGEQALRSLATADLQKVWLAPSALTIAGVVAVILVLFRTRR